MDFWGADEEFVHKAAAEQIPLKQIVLQEPPVEQTEQG